jgi:hypothetical protein
LPWSVLPTTVTTTIHHWPASHSHSWPLLVHSTRMRCRPEVGEDMLQSRSI